MDYFQEGYYAGLVDDYECPYGPLDPARYLWLAGNAIGLEQHRMTVEHVYLNLPHD
jgi:hypothetical protein